MDLLPEDKALIQTLLDSGMDAIEVADKFELHVAEMLQAINPGSFRVPNRVFDKRCKRGVMRVNGRYLERECPRCQEFLPFDDEFWHRDKATNDGAWTMCRACEQTRRRNKYWKAKESLCTTS